MKMKFLSVLAGLIVFLGTASQGWSAIMIRVGNTTFDWERAPATVLDKTFTWLSDSIPLEPAAANLYAPLNLSGNFVLELTDLAFIPVPATFTLDYKVQINQPNYSFDAITLDSAHMDDGFTVTKSVYSDAFSTKILELTSVNGSKSGPISLAGNLDTIWVRDTVVVQQGGRLSNITNTFTQRAVPEPASLAIWGGMAVLGLIFARRRMKK